MIKPDFKNIMLDTSFCIRLMKKEDVLHANALEYFQYFLAQKITMHVSTIALAEYAVGEDPAVLPLSNLQIEAFDFSDAKMAGTFHKEIKSSKSDIVRYNRRIITNDVKILAQIETKKIDAIITKDVRSYSEYVQPLITANMLQVKFFDLNIPLNEALGILF